MGQSYKETDTEFPGSKSLITESRNEVGCNSRKGGAGML